ncbi:MAG: primosomal protein N', partial [Actinomycetota bacterium]
LVRGADRGGTVVLVAPAGLPPVEALLRWSPQWHARHELDEREALLFPPAATILTLTGERAAVAALLAASDLPADVEQLGPVPVTLTRAGEPQVRTLLRTTPDAGTALAAAVRAGVSVRSARKDTGSVVVRRDPLELV